MVPLSNGDLMSCTFRRDRAIPTDSESSTRTTAARKGRSQDHKVAMPTTLTPDEDANGRRDSRGQRAGGIPSETGTSWHQNSDDDRKALAQACFCKVILPADVSVCCCFCFLVSFN